MASTRNEVVKIAQSLVGTKQGSKKHKNLVDTFNSVKPNGEVGNYKCAWCAITWTAIQIKAGNTQKEVPMSYNCGTLVDQAKKLKIWVENDAYKARKGDGIIYNWNDNGVGDCKTGASHIGIIESRSKGYYTVIEGNKGTTKMCGRRKIAVNGRFIRGFICPKYAGEVAEPATEVVAEPKVTKAEKLGIEAKRIAWAFGTAPSKYSYEKGNPTANCKTDMKARGYDTRVEYSDCGYFINTIIYHAIGKKVKSLPKTSEKFGELAGFKVAYDGKSIKLSQLKKYDIVRYKRVDSKGNTKQHVGMYMGRMKNKGGKLVHVWAEAGRGTRFGVIHTTSKFLSKKLKQIQILRAIEV